MPLSDTFTLTGSYASDPSLGSPGNSGLPSVVAPLTETLQLDQKQPVQIDLTTDAAVDIPFGGVTNANVVIIQTTGGKVRARVTSTDGATQAIPVDDLLILIGVSVPITALDVTRVPGQLTTVSIFLGQIA